MWITLVDQMEKEEREPTKKKKKIPTGEDGLISDD